MNSWTQLVYADLSVDGSVGSESADPIIRDGPDRITWKSDDDSSVLSARGRNISIKGPAVAPIEKRIRWFIDGNGKTGLGNTLNTVSSRARSDPPLL